MSDLNRLTFRWDVTIDSAVALRNLGNPSGPCQKLFSAAGTSAADVWSKLKAGNIKFLDGTSSMTAVKDATSIQYATGHHLVGKTMADMFNTPVDGKRTIAFSWVTGNDIYLTPGNFDWADIGHEISHKTSGKIDCDLMDDLRQAGYKINPNGASEQYSRLIRKNCH